MANISQLIQKIRSAIYGEEVRGSIADALTAMNTETESYVEQAAAQVELATQQAENSSTSATASAGSATSSANSAITSKSWAVGGTGTREGEDTNNAKYWCDQARKAGGDVTGVKGNEETEYRTGNVNLTCENIGAATASDMEQAQTDINQLNQSLITLQNYQKVIDGNTSGGNTTANYPEGFTKDNCVVESVMVANNGNWAFYINPTEVIITLRDSDIGLYTTAAYFMNVPYKLSLRKYKS